MDKGHRAVIEASSEPPRKSKVVAVILDYRRPDLLQRCLASIPADEVPSMIVVENSEIDPVPVGFTKSGAEIEVIVNGRNLGFAAGMNVGIRSAVSKGADTIVLLNNDVLVDAHSLRSLFAVLDSSPTVGMAIPNQASSETLLRRQWPKKLTTRRAFSRNSWDQSGSRLPEWVNWERATGFCLAVKREVFERIGLLDEDFVFGKEDDEISHRIHLAGYAIAMVPDSIVLHRVSSSTNFSVNEQVRFLSYHSARGRAILARKLRSQIVLSEAAAIADALRVTLKSLAMTGTITAASLRAAISGFRDGLNAQLHPPPRLYERNDGAEVDSGAHTESGS